MKPIGTCFKNEFLQEIKFQLITAQNKDFLLQLTTVSRKNLYLHAAVNFLKTWKLGIQNGYN